MAYIPDNISLDELGLLAIDQHSYGVTDPVAREISIDSRLKNKPTEKRQIPAVFAHEVGHQEAYDRAVKNKKEETYRKNRAFLHNNWYARKVYGQDKSGNIIEFDSPIQFGAVLEGIAELLGWLNRWEHTGNQRQTMPDQLHPYLQYFRNPIHNWVLKSFPKTFGHEFRGLEDINKYKYMLDYLATDRETAYQMEQHIRDNYVPAHEANYLKKRNLKPSTAKEFEKQKRK